MLGQFEEMLHGTEVIASITPSLEHVHDNTTNINTIMVQHILEIDYLLFCDKSLKRIF